MLITLMLFLALLAVAALAVLPEMTQQIKRDREEEMCHRGTQYMRAIQRFYKKVGRYPTSIEDLEKTNNVRYLRRRYKDPLSVDPETHKERDFKLLHMQDVSLNNGPVMPGATMLGQNGLTGGQNGLQGALGQMQQLAQMQQGGLQQGGLQQGQPAQNNTGDDQSGSGNSGSGNSGTGGTRDPLLHPHPPHRHSLHPPAAIRARPEASVLADKSLEEDRS